MFPAEMEKVVQWVGLEEMIEPFYRKKRNGCSLFPLGTKLLKHFLLQDEITVMRYRHLLEKHYSAVEIFAEFIALVLEKRLSMRRGTVADSKLIVSPSSTKNEDNKRVPEITLIKESNQRHFGMKAHIGAVVDSDLIHSVDSTTAK